MYSYKWGDVCDENWTDFAATIVCKELGFVHGVAECCSALGPSDFRYSLLPNLEQFFILAYRCVASIPQVLLKVSATI